MNKIIDKIQQGIRLLRSELKSLLLATIVLSFSAQADAGTITNMRIGPQPGGVRVVLDSDSSIDYQTFLLSDPKRLVVDVYNTNIGNIPTDKKNTLISGTRVGKLDGNDKRIVFDLQKPVLIKKAFVLPPQTNMTNWRFVVDLALTSERDFESKVGTKYALSGKKSSASSASSVKTASNSSTSSSDSGSWFSSSKSKSSKVRKKIVVLDPGHGGKDPGAIGAYGKTYEKNITLAMGKELKGLLEKEGYTVYLTRSTDIFIPLRQRVKIAQKYKADLFMSIHADSALNRNAKGLSVYTLSETASDKEAAALAERENKSDIIDGVDFSGNSREINDILISLSQTDSRNKSSKFAGYIVNEMRQSVKLVDNTHRFAGFAVLKAPDIPSALLEMGYLSNKQEESNLKQSSYRLKLARSVTKAINKYFSDPEIAALF
jgi:N-acetylmuramoyl-L-alanine amidase